MLVYDLIDLESLSNERNTSANTLAIITIVVAKELDQILFLIYAKSQQIRPTNPSSSGRERGNKLTSNPILEKVPQNNRITHKTNLVAHHNLRAHRKEIVPKVTRMAEVRVEARSHQHVVVFLALGWDVVETDSCLRHGDAADDLSRGD